MLMPGVAQFEEEGRSFGTELTVPGELRYGPIQDPNSPTSHRVLYRTEVLPTDRNF